MTPKDIVIGQLYTNGHFDHDPDQALYLGCGLNMRGGRYLYVCLVIIKGDEIGGMVHPPDDDDADSIPGFWDQMKPLNSDLEVVIYLVGAPPLQTIPTNPSREVPAKNISLDNSSQLC